MSIELEDFTVACIDSRFDVAPIDNLKKCNSNFGPRKCQKLALARLLRVACFHLATKIVYLLVMDPCYARSVTGSINFQLHSIIMYAC